jgi:hypothetical protein
MGGSGAGKSTLLDVSPPAVVVIIILIIIITVIIITIIIIIIIIIIMLIIITTITIIILVENHKKHPHHSPPPPQVLAHRKTGGTIAGEFLIRGRPGRPSGRWCAYVTQDNVHVSCFTVRETMQVGRRGEDKPIADSR